MKEPAKNPNVIFTPPTLSRLLSPEELSRVAQTLEGLTIPAGLGNVQKAHWVKYEYIERLGYPRPPGLRTRQARAAKPKFLNQLLDIFVQSSTNLQVWNYVPYADIIIPGDWNLEWKRTFADCRYLLVIHDASGLIRKTHILTGHDLRSWDRTGTQTIKWQANIRGPVREKGGVQIYGPELPTGFSDEGLSLEEKRALISEQDTEAQPLVRTPPQSTTLMSMQDLAMISKQFVGRLYEAAVVGQERVTGQLFEQEFAAALGYSHVSSLDQGTYPDLLNQLVEVKFQFSNTIDLGRHNPTDAEPLPFEWNTRQLSPRDVRYVVAMISEHASGRWQTVGVFVAAGIDFERSSSICEGTNFKVQLRIPLDLLKATSRN